MAHDSEPTDALAERIEPARRAVAGVALRTPLFEAEALSAEFGMPVVVKAENLQRTGSFKLRGAVAKLAALGGSARDGVVVGSAGNHARAVAYAARLAGVGCEVFMPEGASINKVEAVKALGASVRLEWPSVDDAVSAAIDHAAGCGRPFVHPFDDLDVIAGQSTIGFEVLDDAVASGIDVKTIVVPIGGGGLISGVAAAVRRTCPDIRIVGVQAAACAPVPLSLDRHEPVTVTGGPTIADGIAVRRPGDLTFRLIESLVDEVCTVDDDAIAEAVVHLFEVSKLVVEGAGAAGAAALLGGLVARPRSGHTVVLLSGGNIDPAVLANAIRRHETRAGRRVVCFARLDDRPGTLSVLLRGLADLGVNVVDIQHVREGIDLHYAQTGVQLVLQVRDREQTAAMLEWAHSRGLDLTRVPGVA